MRLKHHTQSGLRTFIVDELVGDALLAGFSIPAWQRDGACTEHPDVEFFPERGVSSSPAKGVCGGCVVRRECLEYALEQGVHFPGIWGGLSQRERRRLLR